MSDVITSTAFPMMFAACLPGLQEVARQHGYALACYGSMATDLDLVAFPWSEEATDAEALIEAIRGSVGGTIGDERHNDTNPTLRPHGRKVWAIFLQEELGPYLDISVIPRLVTK